MKYDFDECINRKDTHSIKWSLDVLKDKYTLPFWIADMDFRCPQPVIDSLVKTAEHGIFGYSDLTDSYYNAVISWFEKRHGWKISRDWIVVTPGVIFALNVIVRTFCRKGDKVIIQTPAYHPFFKIILNNGCHPVYNQLKVDNSRYTMDFELLSQQARDPKVKLIILCSPHNPIGRVWREKELRELGEICLKNEVLVVADEIHSDFVYKEFEHKVFSTITEDLSQNSIICTAPSKTFNLAGLHISNIVIPNRKIRQNLAKAIENTGVKLFNIFGIAATIAAYEAGEEWLTQLLAYLEGNIDLIDNYINEKIPEVKFIKPEGTYLAWLDFRLVEQDIKKLEELLRKKAKVYLDEGYIFGNGGEGFERLNFACPRSLLMEAMDRIYNAIRY